MLKKYRAQLLRWIKSLVSLLISRDNYAIMSYSQEGEDLILNRIFERQARGFYVDVGAFHPQRFSNTHIFYKRGWSGINIEPNPDAIHLFQRDRPRDINLQTGISIYAETLTYHMFSQPALNTFDADLAKLRLASQNPSKLVKSVEIPVERLDSILLTHLPANQLIDFLSIDAEGLDFTVLKSNDWQRFRPRIVLVEALTMTLEEVLLSRLFIYMKANGYELIAKTFNTLIFHEK